MAKQRGKDGKFAKSHSGSRTDVYGIWANILYRCNTATAHQYNLYGGRGIAVCKEWQESFEAFAEHMGPRPAGASVDRIDNNGNYEPGNVRWATAKEQADNRRNTIRILGMTVEEAAKATSLPLTTIKNRVRRGWPAERIISQPRRQYLGVASC